MGSYTEPYPGNEMWKSFTKTWHTRAYPQISPTRPELDAAGKVIFITGGGSGIGKATAVAFAQAGAKAIAIFGRRLAVLKSAAEEIHKAGNDKTHVVFESVDLTQRPAITTAFTNAVAQIGGAKIDIFINNAGVLPASGEVGDYSEQDFHNGMDMIMGSGFNSIQAVLPLLASNAKLFNASSAIAVTDYIPGVWIYSAMKAATTKMFDYLQVENPDLHIVNVHPGVVATDINPGVEGQDEIELPAHFHVWLASSEAEFLKGKFVWVNWDVYELKARADEIKKSLLLKVALNGVPM